VSDITDPTNKGTVAVPTHPDGDNDKKKGLPPQGMNEDGQKESLTNMPGQVGSGGTGEVPGNDSTISGNAKDEAFTSPTTDLGKIAGLTDRAVKLSAALMATGLVPAKAAAGMPSPALGAPAAAPAASAATPAAPAATPAAPAPVVPKAANSAPSGDPVSDVTDPTKKPAAKPSHEPHIGGVPAEQKPNKDKSANILPEEASPEFFSKLANVVRAITEIEGGAKAIEDLLTKQAGADKAREFLNDINVGYATFQKAAAEAAAVQQAHEAYLGAVQHQFTEMMKGASEEQKSAMTKLADAIFPVLDTLQDPWEKAALMQGVQDQGAMEDAGAFGNGPEAAQATLPGGGEGPLPIEQIAQLLGSMVDAGELSADDAQGVLQDITSKMQAAGGGDAGGVPATPPADGGGAAPAAPAGDGGAPPAEPKKEEPKKDDHKEPDGDEGKSATLKAAKALLASIPAETPAAK